MRLLEPQHIKEAEFQEFISEFETAGEKLVPYSLNMKGLDFQTYIQSLIDESRGIEIAVNWVPASTFFLVDDHNKILGAVNIRHKLTENLEIEGGHIGYGIRPSQRSKGLGTLQLKLALHEARELGIDKVLITCSKDNTGSAKVIQNNGGKLDSEIMKEGRIVQRWWVKN
jgi:predicted acetyltransferase